MPFVKGDPNCNRAGRPKNAEPELLRAALKKEGYRRGVDFWDKVAEYAFRDRQVMIAVLKKFVPDMSITEIQGEAPQTRIVIIRPGANDTNDSGSNREPAAQSLEGSTQALAG